MPQTLRISPREKKCNPHAEEYKDYSEKNQIVSRAVFMLFRWDSDSVKKRECEGSDSLIPSSWGLYRELYK